MHSKYINASMIVLLGHPVLSAKVTHECVLWFKYFKCKNSWSILYFKGHLSLADFFSEIVKIFDSDCSKG